MPAAGVVVKELAWADTVTLGNLTLYGVQVQEANDAQMAGSRPGYLGTLGFRALERLRLNVDGRRGTAYALSLLTPASAPMHNRLGATFVPRNLQSKDLVAHVVPGSPADEAGIQDGDLLLKIDDLDMTQWQTDPRTSPKVGFWMRPAGTAYVVTIKRGDQTMQKKVTLRDLIGPTVSGRASAVPPAKN
jgi:hypothetical protein